MHSLCLRRALPTMELRDGHGLLKLCYPVVGATYPSLLSANPVYAVALKQYAMAGFAA